MNLNDCSIDASLDVITRPKFSERTTSRFIERSEAPAVEAARRSMSHNLAYERFFGNGPPALSYCTASSGVGKIYDHYKRSSRAATLSWWTSRATARRRRKTVIVATTRSRGCWLWLGAVRRTRGHGGLFFGRAAGPRLQIAETGFDRENVAVSARLVGLEGPRGTSDDTS